MTYSFTRVRIATGLAVALTWFSQSAVWADCYDSGFNDGLAQCQGFISQGQCDSQKSGLLTQENCNSQCNSQYNGYITQGVCDSQKSGLLTQENCNSQYNGYITQSSCNSEKDSLNSQLSSCHSENGTLRSQLSSCGNGLITQGDCNSQYNGYITQDACNNQYKDQMAKSTCDSEKNTLNSQLKTCNTDLLSCGNGLITQDACNNQYKGYILESSCRPSTKEICKSTYITTLFTQEELDQKKTEAIAQYTGYVDTTTSATPTAKSCKETPENAACIGTTLKGFKEGYNEGQLSLAGYTTKDENGKTVAKSCKLPSDDPTCQQPGNLQGFIKGYQLGEGTTTKDNNLMTVAECQKAPNTCTNPDFKAGRDTGKAEATAQYTGYVDTDGTAKSCSSESTPDQTKCANKQGFTDGYNARNTFCETNPQLCIMTYLQGFYKFFVEKRLSNVKNFGQSFPQELKVSPAGGPTPTELADQWRYTWKTKTQGCDALNESGSGKKFKPFKPEGNNKEISICLEQKDDGTEKSSTEPGFGSSKDNTALEPNQSLGYTVYLMDKQDKVKATMEIIFSPDSGAAATTTPTTGGGTTSDTTGGTADTATTGSTTSTETEGSTTPATGKTNP